jgi:hypothetical protein
MRIQIQLFALMSNRIRIQFAKKKRGLMRIRTQEITKGFAWYRFKAREKFQYLTVKQSARLGNLEIFCFRTVNEDCNAVGTKYDKKNARTVNSFKRAYIAHRMGHGWDPLKEPGADPARGDYHNRSRTPPWVTGGQLISLPK